MIVGKKKKKHLDFSRGQHDGQESQKTSQWLKMKYRLSGNEWIIRQLCGNDSSLPNLAIWKWFTPNHNRSYCLLWAGWITATLCCMVNKLHLLHVSLIDRFTICYNLLCWLKLYIYIYKAKHSIIINWWGIENSMNRLSCYVGLSSSLIN